MLLLPRTIDWYVLASDNPRLSETPRAVLQLRLAKLYVLNGEFAKAVASAKDAVGTDPGHIVYMLELAALYLALEDLDAAERTIAAAEDGMSPSGINRGLFRDLKSDLERARRHEKAAIASQQ